jgi:hypothetical protein
MEKIRLMATAIMQSSYEKKAIGLSRCILFFLGDRLIVDVVASLSNLSVSLHTLLLRGECRRVALFLDSEHFNRQNCLFSTGNEVEVHLPSRTTSDMY